MPPIRRGTLSCYALHPRYFRFLVPTYRDPTKPTITCAQPNSPSLPSVGSSWVLSVGGWGGLLISGPQVRSLHGPPYQPSVAPVAPARVLGDRRKS